MGMVHRISPKLEKTLLMLETQVWDALVVGDAAVDRALLDPDFLGVYPDGFAGQDAHVGQLAEGPSVDRYSLDGVRYMTLGPACWLISYEARFARPGGAEQRMFVSSIWRQKAEGWVNVFSQDTPAA